MKEDIMSEEAFREVIENIELISNMTLYGRKNIKHYFNKLLRENKHQADIIKNSVSKDKVIEKIEELDNEFNERNSKDEDFNYNYGEEYSFAKDKLKELLEGDE